MAVFIEITTDAFADRLDAQSVGIQGVGAGLPRVRRPTRGLEIKEDTYAYIKLIDAAGKEIPLINSSEKGGFSTQYSNFMLQSVQESRMERNQIIETFGDTYMFLFGEAPRFLQVQAVLLNSFDFNWEAEFDANYDRYLRGTKAVERGARCYLFYDDNVVEGYILNAQKQKNAGEPLSVQLNFQFFVTSTRNVSMLENGGDFPIRYGVDPATAERSSISDNTDEYTAIEDPLEVIHTPGVYSGRYEPGEFTEPDKQKIWSVPAVMYQYLNRHGVPRHWASSPFTQSQLGLGPAFLPGGVGVGYAQGRAGAIATFGAHASAYAGAGAFVGAGASTGFSAFAGASAGVSFSASAGVFAGAGVSVSASAYASASASALAYAGATTGLRSGAYAGSATNTYAGVSPYYGTYGGAYAGMSAGAYPLANSGAFGFVNLTARTWGQSAAYASAQAGVQSGYGSYAYSSAQASARAGGYAGAGAYLGTSGYRSYAGASYAGGVGAGASVSVGGYPSAFAFISAPGTLLPSDPYRQGYPYNQSTPLEPSPYAWHREWSWPSADDTSTKYYNTDVSDL